LFFSGVVIVDEGVVGLLFADFISVCKTSTFFLGVMFDEKSSSAVAVDAVILTAVSFTQIDAVFRGFSLYDGTYVDLVLDM
jgi:16S rRNA C1402 N4-methylase RsmH